MLPAIVGLLVALAVLLMLLAALRTSKGRKLLSKLRERAKKQKDDGPMTTGANVRENDTQLGMPSSEELADLDLSTSFFDSLMVKLRILISMIQVLSQLGVVYAIPFPSLYSNLLRWVGLLELNFIDILPLGCVMSVGFHFSLLMRTLVLPALLLAALAAKVVRALEPERAQWHDPVLGRWLGLRTCCSDLGNSVEGQFWCGAPWLGVSARGPFMHGAGRKFHRRKSPPDRLAEYHPSEVRGC